MISDSIQTQSAASTAASSVSNIGGDINGFTPATESKTTGRPHAKSLSSDTKGSATFPPPKTDKPRPHQKLHMTTTPSSRPRQGRRESTSTTGSAAPGRVRKNSVLNPNSAREGHSAMRPRANTISHVDHATLGMLAGANANIAQQAGFFNMSNPHYNDSHISSSDFDYRVLANPTGHGNPHGLPKLDTQNFHMEVGGGMRTAPAFRDFGYEYGMEDFLFGGGSGGNTINPAQLHSSAANNSSVYDSPLSSFRYPFHGMNSSQDMLQSEMSAEWMHGFDHQLSFESPSEHAIAGSSPSASTGGSPGDTSEMNMDGGSIHQLRTTESMQNSVYSHMMPVDALSSHIDLSTPTIPEYPTDHFSPQQMQDQLHQNGITSAGQSMHVHTAFPPPESFYHPPIVASIGTPTNSAASVSSSNRQSSVTSISTDTITDATRQALLNSLSQPSILGVAHRKYSQPAISSPLSPGFSARPASTTNISLPSTQDLQRFIAAYVRYFHPHLPFLHIPSLSFDSPTYAAHSRSGSGHTSGHQSGAVGGGGCLILSLAAIGALYEYDNSASKELFEMARRMIKIYLDDRRKADMSAALNGSESSSNHTPLWLVQAMLLNAIYGHNCGDKTGAEIAKTSCAALVSLTRAADLTRSPPQVPNHELPQQAVIPSNEDIQMGNDGWNLQGISDDNGEWNSWIVEEERKRTLFSVFIMSSMLVSAYNHAPALMNSEIQLDLPCDEELWSADSAAAWYALGGPLTARRSSSFASALTTLLEASQRNPGRPQQSSHIYLQNREDSNLVCEDHIATKLRPSTFGCLVLINALHNYIWETRQRHLGREWTPQETEAMHSQIEPALAAFQAAWMSDPQHSFERPNPFGVGPLSSDSIPLLDLAYVRLFVNLGRSKEAFWRHDFDAMADELAEGNDIIQHADSSPRSTAIRDTPSGYMALGNGTESAMDTDSSRANIVPLSPGHSTKRERQLRKAAFHAAHSLIASDKFGVSFADPNSRELPMSSALCAFDCTQVVAEWIALVQERVGRFLGVLGKDAIDFTQVPAIMLLEDEDCKLLEKISQILASAQGKMSIEHEINPLPANSPLARADEYGFAGKILLVTAYLFERTGVWPVTRLMARCLETQATHMKIRAEKSVVNME
ncbi:hypothetical protein MMC25_003738 [Agyrium rufum]|nr:hypothetical protein [Agyrium rufum]